MIIHLFEWVVVLGIQIILGDVCEVFVVGILPQTEWHAVVRCFLISIKELYNAAMWSEWEMHDYSIPLVVSRHNYLLIQSMQKVNNNRQVNELTTSSPRSDMDKYIVYHIFKHYIIIAYSRILTSRSTKHQKWHIFVFFWCVWYGGWAYSVNNFYKSSLPPPFLRQ